jgi:hypothetical protein
LSQDKQKFRAFCASPVEDEATGEMPIEERYASLKISLDQEVAEPSSKVLRVFHEALGRHSGQSVPDQPETDDGPPAHLRDFPLALSKIG